MCSPSPGSYRHWCHSRLQKEKPERVKTWKKEQMPAVTSSAAPAPRSSRGRLGCGQGRPSLLRCRACSIHVNPASTGCQELTSDPLHVPTWLRRHGTPPLLPETDMDRWERGSWHSNRSVSLSLLFPFLSPLKHRLLCDVLPAVFL